MAMAVVSAWQLALDCCAMCFYILSCVKKVQTVRGQGPPKSSHKSPFYGKAKLPCRETM